MIAMGIDIPKLAVSAIVGVILLMALAVPIFSVAAESSSSPVYGDNETYIEKMARGTSYRGTITVDVAGEGASDDVYMLNGTAMTTSKIFVTDKILIEIRPASNVSNHVVLLDATAATEGAQRAHFNMNAGDKITFSGNTVKITAGSGSSTAPRTVSYSWIYYSNDNGEYIRAAVSAQPYIDSNTPFIAFDSSGTTAGSYVSNGTLESPNILYSTVPYTISTTYVADGYSNRITGVNVTYEGTTVEAANIIVPVEYTVDLEPSMISSILGVVPILLAVGIILSVVAIIYQRGSD